MGRAPCCDKTKVKKGPWCPEEDHKLKSYIEKHGTGGNWIALPHKIGLKRCGKSCRLRWLNYLRPNIKHGGFTEDEDNLICNLYIAIGSRWSIIAAQLPGRTDNDIKNYWNTKLKKKLLDKHRKEAGKQLVTKKRTESLHPTHESSSHMPQFEAKFSYDYTPVNDQYVETSINHVQVPDIDFPAFDDNIPEDITYGNMLQRFDGVQSFSPGDMFNGSIINSVSQDNSSWGDVSSVVHPCVLTNYEEWTLLDEPRLLGY